MWKGKSVERLLRSFINLTTVTIYENLWADLSSIRILLNYRSDSIEASKLNWRNTWTVLKRFQWKKFTSMKRSKALIFRIKCINKLLPMKDLYYQRDSVMYKSKTCIACFVKEESLEHLAECCIYQKIWEKIEGIILEELDLRLNKK